MSRYIDADSMKEWIDEYVSVFKKSDNKDIKGYIEHQPTIEPKRGKWKIEETESVWGKGYLLTCSVCGDTLRVTENALPYEKYCRNCGADMRERESE